jgi:hypothetical protein
MVDAGRALKKRVGCRRRKTAREGKRVGAHPIEKAFGGETTTTTAPS